MFYETFSQVCQHYLQVFRNVGSEFDVSGRARVIIDIRARFYGLYEKLDSRIKRFSFVVLISPRLNNKMKHKCMVIACSNLLRGRIPEHKRGQVFSSFDELFATRWFKVKRLVRYKAGVVYAR